MLNAWLKETTQLFAEVSVESDAASYVPTHKEELSDQLTAIIKELSDLYHNERAAIFLALPQQEQLNFAICKLAMTVHSIAMISDGNSAEKMETLRNFINVQFKKTDIGGFLAHLKSDSLRLMSSTESLGRLNLSEELTTTPLSYEALFLRMKCEALYPNFMTALYQAFSPEQELLTIEQQRQAVKEQISEYLTSIDFYNFTRIPLDYTGLTSLIGDRSVQSLFVNDADKSISDGLVNLVKKHFILQALSQNPALPRQDSLEQILKYIAMFSVLASKPYSFDRARSPGTTEIVFTNETTPTPETLKLIAELTFATYQTYEATYQLVKNSVAQSIDEVTANEPDPSISMLSLLDLHTGKTLARAFDLHFSPIIEQADIEQEHAFALADQAARLYELFASSTNIPLAPIPIARISEYLMRLDNLRRKHPEVAVILIERQRSDHPNLGHIIAQSGDLLSMQLYLALSQALSQQFPGRIFAALSNLVPQRETTSIHDAVNELITDESSRSKYHKLMVDTIERELASTQESAMYMAFKPQITTSLLALPPNEITLALLNKCLAKENAVGNFLLAGDDVTINKLTADIQNKITNIEKTLGIPLPTNPVNQSTAELHLSTPHKKTTSSNTSTKETPISPPPGYGHQKPLSSSSNSKTGLNHSVSCFQIAVLALTT